MSNDKKKSFGGTVPAETTATVDYGAPIPLNERWRVTEFGAADINNGDNKSSVYLLKYGGVPVDGAFISVTGSTLTLQKSWDFVGDGVKTLSVERRNTSKTAKEMPVWLFIYKVE